MNSLISEMPGPLVAREGARAVPVGAEHHADRREFVLGLDHRVVRLAGLGIDAQLRAEALNASISEVDGVIGYHGADGRARIDRAEAGRGVAVDHEVAAVASMRSMRSGSGQGRCCFA